jgi:hypothetical protein
MRLFCCIKREHHQTRRRTSAKRFKWAAWRFEPAARPFFANFLPTPGGDRPERSVEGGEADNTAGFESLEESRCA